MGGISSIPPSLITHQRRGQDEEGGLDTTAERRTEKEKKEGSCFECFVGVCEFMTELSSQTRLREGLW